MNDTNASLLAEHVMTAEPVCVTPATTIRELARVFEENEISGAPVVNHQGALVGVVSKTDLIRRCSEGIGNTPPAYLFEAAFDEGDSNRLSERLPRSLICVQDIMTQSVVTVTRATAIEAVAGIMARARIHRVIVVDDAQVPAGIITSLDVVGAVASCNDHER